MSELNQEDRGIITFAYGAREYIDLSIALGQSLQRFSPHISRALVTDSGDPKLRSIFHSVIPVRKELGSDVAQKLYIDVYSPFVETLFIDCDSLVVRDLDFAFQLFRESGACAIGTNLMLPGEIVQGVVVSEVCDSLKIPAIPRFNGGIYYIDKNGESAKVIARARELLKDYKKYGFKDFRSDGPNDEFLMGAAMAELGLLPIGDHGSLMRTPIGLIGKLHVDVLKGEANFNKEGSNVAPAVVHFAGEWRKDPVYVRERRKLHFLETNKVHAKIAARLYSVTYDFFRSGKKLIGQLWKFVPPRLRHLYHGLKSRVTGR
jgi:hypothetical protein